MGPMQSLSSPMTTPCDFNETHLLGELLEGYRATTGQSAAAVVSDCKYKNQSKTYWPVTGTLMISHLPFLTDPHFPDSLDPFFADDPAHAAPGTHPPVTMATVLPDDLNPILCPGH